MAIVGNNSILNQYVPTFCIKNIQSGQTLVYDSTRKAFVNATPAGGGPGGVTKLGELTDVSASVDDPLSLRNGHTLTYNSTTELWENAFVNFETLVNKPTSNNYSFAGLSDTAKPALPSGYVQWNSAGTQLVYSTTIPASDISGLAQVATSGNYNDLSNLPNIPPVIGSVTNVSAAGNSGVVVSIDDPTTTPNIEISLGNITPASVSSTGTITGANLSGTNTGDQTITLTGDVTGSGTGEFSVTLADVNTEVGTFGSGILVPQITVDSKGRITNVVDVPITATGIGTVTEVSVVANNGIGVTVTDPTTTPSIELSLGDITPTSVSSTGTISGSNLSGTNTGDQTITLTGDVLGSGTGSFATTLSETGVTAGSYTNADVTVSADGRITSISNGTDLSALQPEIVVFRYTSGSAGNLSGVDAIFSQTAGVTPVITDGSNCIVNFSFTGKANLPKSITIYGQVYADNTFVIKDTTSLPTAKVVGGGTAASPGIVNGIFGATNTVTLQTRMADTGASASIGQRAWLIVVFGF